MQLTAKKREGGLKGAVKRARRAGKIPAVYYVLGQPSQSIEIDGAEFNAAMRKIKQNHLSTTVFTIELDGASHRAIVKGIQYDRVTYDVIHLDFEGLDDERPVELNIPIEFTGVADCVGIKLGGNLRQVIRNVRVKCFPKDIPNHFELDVREMKIRDAKKLSDIALPSGVTPIRKVDEVVVVIAKR